MSDRSAPPAEQAPAFASTVDRDFEFDRVRQAVRGIRYGEVRVIIQDGLIVQIERLEKLRIR